MSVVVLLVALLAAAVALGLDPAAEAQEFIDGLYPPIAVTEEGARIRDLYTIVFIIAAVIFLLVEGLIIWSVIRYRRKPGDDTLPPQTHGNNLAELVWTIVPTIIVVFLFVVSWQTLNAVDSPEPKPQRQIRAVAGQFQWQFDYLDNDGSTILFTQLLPTGDGGGMAVPVGETIRMTLTSPDVIHAFYVPQFLFKRDVVPGRVNQFDFKVNESDAGQTFRGQCAELCGTGHRLMLFEVNAMTPTDFDAWLQERIAQANATPPPRPSGEAGASPPPAPPSGGANASPPPPPPSGGAGATVDISALNVAFEQTEVRVPAGAPFRIAFNNKDPGIPHNVAIHRDSPTGQEVFKGEIFPGPDKRDYDVPQLEAGTYAFVCSVHPNMTGTLIAE